MYDPAQSLHVLILGNWDLLRAGLRALLEKLPEVQRVEDCSVGDLPVQAALQRFDLFVIEIEDARTAWESVFEDIRSTAPSRPIVVVTGSHVREHVKALYAAGAAAVVLKQQPPENFIAAVRTAAKGEVWLHRTALLSVLEADQDHGSTEGKKIATLTRREREIIQNIGKGYRNKQIASELCLSEATVRHYLTSIFSKLDVSDRLELLIYAQRHGLVGQTVSQASDVPVKVK